MRDRPGPDPDMPRRLSPEMASFRGLVLAFVREYIAAYAISPSQGEIVHAIEGASKRKVRKALASLARDGLIIKNPGQRGLRLPEAREAARRLLEAEGYRIAEPGKGAVASPESREPGPESPLLPPPALTYPKRRAGE